MAYQEISKLFIAAHPDDEALGCGGTIARWSDQGVAVHLAFLADGIGSRNPDSDAEHKALEQRHSAAEAAARILGASSVQYDDLPDNQLDTIPLLQITQRVEALIETYRPDTVVTHHAGDLNIDHRRVHQAVMTACRPQLGHPVRTILCFEVASSTEWQPPGSGVPFTPNWFEDISTTLPRKLEALDAYAAEMRDWPHPRSREAVEHLARWRGATVGCEAAEAFFLARHLR
ncbi:PIG-L deacetylase family protein [Halorhodospira neutriphila]|uniref:GlcNAc-PI de-N-acetylase n=1 Tax=Halorhodospira neutriphila TaxID=168379 RepID=A0ABS1E1W1_9GAMM|nr:PIG-L deacetylase family protein [Halorhodospira neutriphila]MBK1725453.1 GlcNAc-PI de-N-acetylase [Halorhodospira neutriphila]